MPVEQLALDLDATPEELSGAADPPHGERRPWTPAPARRARRKQPRHNPNQLDLLDWIDAHSAEGEA